jgi:hypothetical protein
MTKKLEEDQGIMSFTMEKVVPHSAAGFGYLLGTCSPPMHTGNNFFLGQAAGPRDYHISSALL